MASGYLEDVWCLLSKFITGFCIFLLMEDGLKLVGWGGLDIVNIAFVNGADAINGDITAIGAPLDITAEIMADGSFSAEGTCVAAIRVGYVDVVVADEGNE